MIYETKAQFRGAIEEKLEAPFADEAWEALSELLEMAAIHQYYTENDVEDAVFFMEKLKEIYKITGET